MFGAYRLRFDPGERGGNGAVSGTVEGVVMRACGTDRPCLPFDQVDSSTNPLTIGTLTVETSDLHGPTAVTAVVTWGDDDRTAPLAFCDALLRAARVTGGYFAVPPTAMAFDAAGAVVVTAPRRVPETLVLAAPGITRMTVRPPRDEVLMPQVCWQLA